MTPRSGEELAELEGRQEPRLVKSLEMVAPGSAVREGIDNIVHARTGGLIVIGDPDELAFLFSGGIKLDIDYSPALLYQLAKMDGAIALNANATKIPWCNVQLMPDPTILTTETGTRHRTAERVSKQTDALVIAVSQRRDVVSLYVDGAKYILEEIPAVLAKANQALATLDKYRSRLDQVSTRLTALEFEGGVTLHDVLTVLQRAELVTRMAVEIERYIVELGTEGRLIEMQLEETMVGVASDKAALPRTTPSRAPSTASRGCRTRTCSTSAAWPRSRATTARSTRSTSPSRPVATASSAAYRGCRSWWSRTSSARSAGWTRSSPPPTPSWNRSTAWERSARRTSARAFAGCRRSTSWTVTCRREPPGGPTTGLPR
jgi:DNA integrity scanning protein DisA with diadenylate cyclase activity